MKCPVCKSHEHRSSPLRSGGFTALLVECRICGTLWSANRGRIEVVKDALEKSFLEGITECVEGSDYGLVAWPDERRYRRRRPARKRRTLINFIERNSQCEQNPLYPPASSRRTVPRPTAAPSTAPRPTAARRRFPACGSSGGVKPAAPAKITTTVPPSLPKFCAAAAPKPVSNPGLSARSSFDYFSTRRCCPMVHLRARRMKSRTSSSLRNGAPSPLS